MKSFKIYFESRDLTVPREDTLEAFLRSLEGKSIKDAKDPFEFNRFHFSHKYNRTGVGGQPEDDASDPEEQHDYNINEFGIALVKFLQRDISKYGYGKMEDREYNQPEFMKEYDYDSYNKARSQQARTGIARNKARREGNDEEYKRLEDKYKELGDFISNHKYQRAMSMISREKDEGLEKYLNTPMTAEYLSDDGSELYTDMVTAFAKLGGDSETVIDV